MILVVFGVIYGFFKTFYFWNTFSKTYLTSFVLLAYLSKSIPICFMLIARLYQGILYVLSTFFARLKSVVSHLNLFFQVGWTIGLAFCILLSTGMIFWEHHFRIKTIPISLSHLPHSFNGFRIVQISDLHLGSWNRKSKLAEAVRMINSLHPDIVVFTGDLCNYCTAEALPFQHILAGIHANDGIYTILGNHDYGAYMSWATPEAKEANLKDLIRLYEGMGWKLLRNSHDVVVRGSDSLAIIGVENWGNQRRFQRLADLPSAMTGTGTVPVKILLTHDPTHWDSIVSKQYPEIAVTLSGHTHGGQLGVESGSYKWSPIQYFYLHWAGLNTTVRDKGLMQYLYVNRGLGTIGYSGRVGIWPEITLIELETN